MEVLGATPCRTSARPATRPPAFRLDQRHQAAPGHLPLTSRRPHVGGEPGGSGPGGLAAAGLTGPGDQGPAVGTGLLRPGHQHLGFQEQPLDALQGYGAVAFQRHGEQVQDPADPAAGPADQDRAARRGGAGHGGQRADAAAVDELQPGQVDDQPFGREPQGSRRAAAACCVRAGGVAMSSSPLTPRTQTRPSRVLVTVSGGKVTLLCTPPGVSLPRWQASGASWPIVVHGDDNPGRLR